MRFPGWLCISVLLSALLLPACQKGGPEKGPRVEISVVQPWEFQQSNFPDADEANPYEDVTVKMFAASWFLKPGGSGSGSKEVGFQWKGTGMFLKGNTDTTKFKGIGIGGGGEYRIWFLKWRENGLKLLLGGEVGVMDLNLTRNITSSTGSNQTVVFQTTSMTASIYAAVGLAGKNIDVFIFVRGLQFFSRLNILPVESYWTDLDPKFVGLSLGWRFK